MLHAEALDTPIGEIAYAIDERGTLCRLSFIDELGRETFEDDLAALDERVAWDDGRCEPLRIQLQEYFGGSRREFRIRVKTVGTEFQDRVWQGLQEIPYGTTISYGELARRIGSPDASRAVGQANNKNPIAIVIPCHRVIGNDGKLTGFGGGMDVKRRLLDLETGQGLLI
ncbi:MAG: methylated-DNA--[protein]-cysteine S-methyltransferase [Acidobacteriota bacterium]